MKPSSDWKRLSAIRERIRFTQGRVWKCFADHGQGVQRDLAAHSEFCVKLTRNYVFFNWLPIADPPTRQRAYAIPRAEWDQAALNRRPFLVCDATSWSWRKCERQFAEIAELITTGVDTLTETCRPAPRRHKHSLTPSFC